MLAIFGWRFTGHAFKGAVEMGQGLETDSKSNLADPMVQIQQETLRLLHSHAGNVEREIHARGFLELFAEVERAHSGLPRHH